MHLLSLSYINTWAIQTDARRKDKSNCRVNDLEFPITHKHHALFETPTLPPSTEHRRFSNQH